MISQVHFSEQLAIQRLLKCFNMTFSRTHFTILEGGGEEPVYHPAQYPYKKARIVFTRNYFSSALHEIAHWCIAGCLRRARVDYGYWYQPDGRDPQQQASFEQVEIKPQALEWIFSVASGIRFRVSADNLNLNLDASDHFKAAILFQAHEYCHNGLPQRAQIFLAALTTEFNTAELNPLATKHYCVSRI